MVKEVPRLRIDGIWTTALDGERGALSEPGLDAPGPKCDRRLELPFSFEVAA
jgi:hypothetical protein